MTLVKALHSTVNKIDEIVSYEEWYWPPNSETGINKGVMYRKGTGYSSDTEMEFLDINLTKDLSFLLHAIHSPSYCRRILKKTILFSGF